MSSKGLVDVLLYERGWRVSMARASASMATATCLQLRESYENLMEGGGEDPKGVGAMGGGGSGAVS